MHDNTEISASKNFVYTMYAQEFTWRIDKFQLNNSLTTNSMILRFAH